MTCVIKSYMSGIGGGTVFGQRGAWWETSMTVEDSKRRVALITGITGQDGTYLAEYLLGCARRQVRPGSRGAAKKTPFHPRVPSCTVTGSP